MQKKKKPIQSVWLKKLLRVHMVATVLSLSAYFLVAFFDPGFLSYDLRQKYHALADDTIVTTATVLGPPEQPVVTGAPVCNSTTGILSVTLDWADDANTYTYDIDRDSLPLVTGLTVSGYTDLNVALGTTYEYIVTANGPMGPGFAASLPVTVVTPSECAITAVAPTVNIVSFGGRGVDSYDGMPSVRDRRPVFSGTTTMPSATIQVVIGTTDSFIASFVANINGYWEWKPPVSLASGTQTFTVTAIDSNDATRQATASLEFGIKKKDDTGGGGTEKTVTSTSNGTAQPSQESPIAFSLVIEEKGDKVLPGQVLYLSLFVKYLSEKYHNVKIPIRFSIVDDKGNILVSLTHEELIRREKAIRKQLDIPSYAVAGTYLLQSEFLFDRLNVSQTKEFTILERPLVRLGGGLTITYPEIVRNLGWITLLMLLSLLLWLLLFIKEYWMYLHALRHITEEQLRKAGFFRKRKGVVR